jgi:hypothetical protein
MPFLSHFKVLEGSELLSFVVKQIRSEEIKGSERMRVNQPRLRAIS